MYKVCLSHRARRTPVTALAPSFLPAHRFGSNARASARAARLYLLSEWMLLFTVRAK